MAVDEDENLIVIQKNDFADSVAYSIREYLRKNLSDPESGSRESGDKFIWAANVDSVLSKDVHKIPFVSISKDGGFSRDLGHDGHGQNKQQSYTLRLVYDSVSNSDLLDKVCQLISEIDNDQDSGPDYNFDLRPVSDSEVTSQPDDRTDYSDHRYKEEAADVTVRGIFGA